MRSSSAGGTGIFPLLFVSTIVLAALGAVLAARLRASGRAAGGERRGAVRDRSARRDDRRRVPAVRAAHRGRRRAAVPCRRRTSIRLSEPRGPTLPPLRRVKQISRWVNGNPFMLSAGSSALGVAAQRLRRRGLRVSQPGAAARRNRHLLRHCAISLGPDHRSPASWRPPATWMPRSALPPIGPAATTGAVPSSGPGRRQPSSPTCVTR